MTEAIALLDVLHSFATVVISSRYAWCMFQSIYSSSSLPLGRPRLNQGTVGIMNKINE